MIVRELITRLGFNMDSAQASKFENRINTMKDKADEVATSLQRVVAVFATLAGGSALVRVADEMQSIRARIGMLPQTVMEAGKAFDVVAERANNAKQGVEEYAGFYIKAANATQDFIKNQEDVLRVVDGVAFGLAASGANATAQSQAFFQLGQAIGSPVVQMEEMNTLIDVAPDLFRELGRVIPGANGNLKKFIGTGAVTGKMLAEGLVKAADVFEEKMRRMPLSIGTASVLIGNRFKLMIDRMNRDSMLVTQVANTMLAVFDKIEAGINFVVKAFDGWGNILRLIGAAVVVALGSKALAVLSAFRLAALIAFLPFLKMIAIGTALTFILEDLYVWFNGGESAIGSFVKWLTETDGAAGLLRIALLTLGAAFTVWAAGAIAASVSAKLAILKSLAVMTFGFLSSALKIAASWLIAFWPAALFLAVIAGIGLAAYKLVENWETVKTWFTEFFDWISKKFNMVGEYIGKYLGKAARFLGIGVGESSQINSSMNPVSASQLAPNNMGMGLGSIQNTTQVNVTVPQGTPQEQAQFLELSAQKSFSKISNSKLARDMSVYAP